MGKLGGRELNYSSDVDVLFLYSDEGGVFKEPPKAKGAKPVLTNHQFFNRLAEAFITEVSRLSGPGMLYRIDLRLRPEGDQGPLTRSLASYENYYAQWGQTWERMMLIKARGVAGDEALAAEFLETIQPFRYPRSINPNVLREVAGMKDRIETEVVKAGELERNVKLGRGGIREIEFICQSLQLLHAGRQPFLQSSQTLPVLPKLEQYQHLAADEVRDLANAYIFLRNVEHRLQMENNLQTHTLPTSGTALNRIARLMGFDTRAAFDKVLRQHTQRVRSIFEHILKAETGSGATGSGLPTEFAGAEPAWHEVLRSHGFRDPERGFKVLREFVEGPGYVHVSERTKELALKLLPNLLALCPGPRRKNFLQSSAANKPPQPPLSDPDRVATRLDSFVAAYGARSTLFELWNSTPAIFELLILLFDRSEFLAELAIRTPDLVDELVTSDRLREVKTSEETLQDLLHGLEDKDQHLWLRRYHQAELMRIGLRDILGLASDDQYLTELSALADACLQYAVASVMRRNKLKRVPFAIIGLGKLGGAEIDYGSDLDILFVAEPKTKQLRPLVKLAQEVMDLVSSRTEQGLVFHMDARLRPDGEKGLLVNSLKAYEEYYRQRALLWEIQSLTRTRHIAGDAGTGKAFQQLAARLSDFRRPLEGLSAYAPDWKQQIRRMRLRIETERTPQGKNDLAIKTGSGGVVDAEFLAQALCLENGWHEANTMRALERAAQQELLPGAKQLIPAYRFLRRVEGVLRRWSYEGETVLPDDPAPYYRVSVRCGFASPDAFRSALSEARQQLRQSYEDYFQKSAG
jgi:glutamate-ammonia-ligase adenylyltransferase